MNIIIANSMDGYMAGRNDGIVFKNVSDEDAKVLEELSKKYFKDVKIIDYDKVTSFSTKSEEDEDDDEVEETSTDTEVKEEAKITDKRKVKKVFVTNGEVTKKILPEELDEYIKNGYRKGRK